MKNLIEKSVLIQAQGSLVWSFLTEPNRMKTWMAEDEMQLEVETSWQIGSDISIQGFHHLKFENRGKVLEYIPNKKLAYNYISSISRLNDLAENYARIDFDLSELNESTQLKLTLQNFPTETIRHHVDFYWNGTLEILKNKVEKANPNLSDFH